MKRQKKWDIQLRYRSGGEWKEMGVMKDLDLYSGENSVRIHLDASGVRQNCLKGAVDQRPSGGREPVRNGRTLEAVCTSSWLSQREVRAPARSP